MKHDIYYSKMHNNAINCNSENIEKQIEEAFSTHTAYSARSQRLESVIHDGIGFTLGNGNKTDIVHLNFSKAFSLRASSPRDTALSHSPTKGRASARML